LGWAGFDLAWLGLAFLLTESLDVIRYPGARLPFECVFRVFGRVVKCWGTKPKSHLGVKQRTPAAGLSNVYQCVCVPVIRCHANFLAKKEILARFRDETGIQIPVIRAINIPNNVLLLPFLPAAFSLLLHLALLRVPIGILALASVWLGLASSHPGQLTPREN